MAAFGYSVGDVIAVIRLANEVRQRFIDAPEQFAAISDEVRSLSILLQDIDIFLPKRELAEDQQRELNDIAKGCRNVLEQLDKWLDEHAILASNAEGLRERSRQALKRLSWDPDVMRDFRSRIASNIGLLNTFYNKLSGKKVIEIKENVDYLVRRKDEKGLQSILNWLDPIDYSAQQAEFNGRRQEGTGQWMLNSSEYDAWMNTVGATMFCPGIPGSGKTIIASMIIDNLRRKFSRDENIGLAYFFCNYQRVEEQKPIDMLANVLKQLIEKKNLLPDGIKDLYETHKRSRASLTLDQMLKTFTAVIASYSKTFLVIDALDEQKYSEEGWTAMISGIFKLQSQFDIRFLATSRFIPEIEFQFEGTIQKEIRANDGDILKYVDGRVCRLLRSRLSKYPDLQSLVKREVLAATDGMFLLAQLHMDSLMTKPTAGALRLALQTLPRGAKGLDKTYDQAFERIKDQGEDLEELAKRVLAWAVYDRRPLTTAEMQHALAVRPGTTSLDEEFIPEVDDMVSACAGLVTMDKNNGIIRLIHYTTQEYLERILPNYFPEAKIYLTTTCLTYLMFDVFGNPCPSSDNLAERKGQNFFLDHAANNWAPLIREIQPEMNEMVSALLADQPRCMNFLQVLDSDSKPNLFYAQSPKWELAVTPYLARFGLDTIMANLLERVENHGDDENVNAALGIAVLYQQARIVELLLTKNYANPNPDSDILFGSRLLCSAIFKRNKDILKLLLQHGNIDLSDAKYLQEPYTDMVEFLLEYDQDIGVNTRNEFGVTPLSSAAKDGYENLVTLLLRRKEIDVNIMDDSGYLQGFVTIVNVLLRNEMPVEWNIDNNALEAYSPLARAVRGGHENIVKLLLAHKEIDVNIGAVAPLTEAIRRGHGNIVKLLLSHKDIDVNINGLMGTPLIDAIDGGHENIVKLILEHQNIDVNGKDVLRNTPISKAILSGHENIVKLLLEHKDIHVNFNGWRGTPLNIAPVSGPENIVKLLLESKNVYPSYKNYVGRTPLHIAAMEGRENVVRLLLRREDIDVNSRDMLGATPLLIAAAEGHKNIMELLLAHKDIDVDADAFKKVAYPTSLSITQQPAAGPTLPPCATLPELSREVEDLMSKIRQYKRC
ncbi:hypothetical protein FQN51_003050 [Onygenales sp. PD_10]|nr:hypothetical protein FQN51_003050 [Onygenales sp. PD_10]